VTLAGNQLKGVNVHGGAGQSIANVESSMGHNGVLRLEYLIKDGFVSYSPINHHGCAGITLSLEHMCLPIFGIYSSGQFFRESRPSSKFAGFGEVDNIAPVHIFVFDDFDIFTSAANFVPKSRGSACIGNFCLEVTLKSNLLYLNIGPALISGIPPLVLAALPSGNPSKEDKQYSGYASAECPKGYICHSPLGMKVATFNRGLQLYLFVCFGLLLLGGIARRGYDDIVPAEIGCVFGAVGLMVTVAWGLARLCL